jgi:hypothetical protein
MACDPFDVDRQAVGIETRGKKALLGIRPKQGVANEVGMACHPVDFFGWKPMPAVGAGDARRQRKPIFSTCVSRAHRVRPPPSKADRLPLSIGHGSDTLSEAPEANTINNQIARCDRGVGIIALVAAARCS